MVSIKKTSELMKSSYKYWTDYLNSTVGKTALGWLESHKFREGGYISIPFYIFSDSLVYADGNKKEDLKECELDSVMRKYRKWFLYAANEFVKHFMMEHKGKEGLCYATSQPVSRDFLGCKGCTFFFFLEPCLWFKKLQASLKGNSRKGLTIDSIQAPSYPQGSLWYWNDTKFIAYDSRRCKLIYKLSMEEGKRIGCYPRLGIIYENNTTNNGAEVHIEWIDTKTNAKVSQKIYSYQ